MCMEQETVSKNVLIFFFFFFYSISSEQVSRIYLSVFFIHGVCPGDSHWDVKTYMEVEHIDSELFS